MTSTSIVFCVDSLCYKLKLTKKLKNFYVLGMICKIYRFFCEFIYNNIITNKNKENDDV